MQMPPLNHCGIVHHLHHLIGIWVVWIKQPTLGQDTSLNSLFIQRLWASRTINYNILTNYLRLIWGCCAVPCSVFRDVLWNRRCLFCFSFCIFLKASVSFVVFFLEDHCWSFFFLPIETWTMVYTSGDFWCFTVTPGIIPVLRESSNTREFLELLQKSVLLCFGVTGALHIL